LKAGAYHYRSHIRIVVTERQCAIAGNSRRVVTGESVGDPAGLRGLHGLTSNPTRRPDRRSSNTFDWINGNVTRRQKAFGK